MLLGGIAPVLVTQDTAGVPGTARANDGFGAALAFTEVCGATRTLLVGAPADNPAGVVDAGSVTVLSLETLAGDGSGSPHRFLSQGAALGEQPERGDGFGSAIVVPPGITTNSMFIGAPGEDLGSGASAALDTGVVHEVTNTCTGSVAGPAVARVISRETAGIPGSSRSGDRFGAALGFHQVDPAVIDVRVSLAAPGQTVVVNGRGRAAAGAVHMAAMGADGRISTSSLLTLETPGIPGTARAGDRLGGDRPTGYTSVVG